MLTFHFCRRQKIQRMVYVSPCQCQPLCLLVFAFPSLVSPQQTHFSSQLQVLTPQSIIHQNCKRWTSGPALFSFSTGLTFSYSLKHLWPFWSLNSAYPNSLQILPLLALSTLQQPPNYPPQHSITPDPCPFNYHYICIIQLTALLLSLVSGCSLDALIPLRFIFSCCFFAPPDIMSHFWRSTSWIFFIISNSSRELFPVLSGICNSS